MRVFIKIKLDKPLCLPINYHQILQAIIYKNLSAGSEYSLFVHDEGYQHKKRKFKLFTFSGLEGKYFTRNKQITFENEVCFEVRSPDIFFIQTVASNLREYGIMFGEQEFRNLTVEMMDDEIEDTELLIKMKTPICIFSTDPETKMRYFYRPDEIMFYQLLNDNFRRKYQACYEVEPEEDIEILPEKVFEKDKYVTRYKNAYISGWKGIYRIRGKRKYINFLYQTGLGSKNSQGFGMFEIVKIHKSEGGFYGTNNGNR